MLFSVSVTTCFTPSAVIRTGDAYSGASPSHRHFGVPEAKSNAIIAPFPCPPRCAMAMPSTMRGDIEVKNRGTVLGNSSLRHRTLPPAASRQERTPPTPSVTTFPSATAGELRGPGCREAGPVTACAATLSFHSSFPSAALRQSVTSSSPCRVKT